MGLKLGIPYFEGGVNLLVTETIPCDAVVFTGDWIPDHELARVGGIPLEPGTRVDIALRTERPGVFASGNVLDPVETADDDRWAGRRPALLLGCAVAPPAR